MALGSASLTTASTFIGSSLGMLLYRKYFHPCISNHYRVLKMGRELTVLRHHRPLILHDLGLTTPHAYHGFYCQGGPREEDDVVGQEFFAYIIRYLGFLMHAPTYPMPGIVLHHRISMALYVLLDAASNLGEHSPWPYTLNGLIKGLLTHLYQSPGRRGHLADGYRYGTISHIFLVFYPYVYTKDISLPQSPGAWYPMYHLFVY